MNVSREDFVPALTQWLKQRHDVRTIVVQTMSGARLMVEDAVKRANMEPVRITTHGLQGVNLQVACQSPIAVTFRRKVIIVYDYDAIVSSDQTLLNHINAAVKTNVVPVVLVGQPVRGKAATLPVKGYHTMCIQNDEYEIRAITYDTKDTFDDKGLDGAVQSLRGRVDVDYRGDGIAFGGVYDNYLTNSSDTTIDDIQRIAEAYSWSDANTEAMCQAGAFEDPYTHVPVSTAAAVFQGRRTKGTVGTFGQVWSKTNAMYSKVNAVHSLQVATRACGAMTQIDGFDWLRSMIVQYIQQRRYGDVAALATSLGITPPKLLLLMRLWKCKYTLSVHAKIKHCFNV